MSLTLNQNFFNVQKTTLSWNKMSFCTSPAWEEKSMHGFKASKDKLTLLKEANAANDYKLKPVFFTVVIQLLSHVWLFATSWTAACQASLSFTISQSLVKLVAIESVRPSNHLILCHTLLLLFSIFPSIRVFSNESVLCIKVLIAKELDLQYQSSQWRFRVDFL